MANLYNIRVEDYEAVTSLLDLFVYTEQKWCTWDKLEESIAEVNYENLNKEELGWFIEFLANCVFRMWRSRKEDSALNRVTEDDVCFFIHNYNWNAFKFGKQKGLDQDLTTKNVICIDKEKLSDKEIKWLESKV